MFTEVFVPKGALSREQLTRLAQRLTTKGLHGGPSDEPGAADPGVLDFMESITHVVVHEVDVWVAGGEPVGTPARYVVRVHVPGPWRKALSASLIELITGALAEFDPDPDRLSDRPHAEVHVLGVPEGSYGAFGRTLDESALVELINKATTGTGEAPEGMAVDPVCGATVPLDGRDTVTAEVDGTTYAFCCAGCRRHFLDKRAEVTT